MSEDTQTIPVIEKKNDMKNILMSNKKSIFFILSNIYDWTEHKLK